MSKSGYNLKQSHSMWRFCPFKLGFLSDPKKLIANPKVFLFVFSLIAILRSAYFVYLMSIMSTLERRYAFPSKMSGFIMIADNISGLFVAPIIGYFGTKLNRPRMIGLSTLLVAVSCFLSGSPYLLYGAGTHLLSGVSLSNLPNKYLKNLANSTKFDICDSSPEICTGEDPHHFQFGAYFLMWIGSFISGLGNTAIWTLALPYLDDNVSKKSSPIYLSTTAVLKFGGVMVGFFISSFSLRLYENPTITVNIPRNDPRFIGAWWLGFFIIGIGLAITSIPMFLFPNDMRKGGKKKRTENNEKMSFSDAYQTFKRVATNPLLVFDTIGGAIRVIGWAGYYVTKTRYIEAQFRQSASASSFLTGLTSSFMKFVGIFAGGITISMIKPKPQYLLAYIVFIQVTCSFIMFSAGLIGCDQPVFGDLKIEDGKATLINDCNSNCTCKQSVFQPTCAADNVTNYFSPCFAGCSTIINENQFTDCKCHTNSSEILTNGWCPIDCNQLPFYLFVLSISGILSSTTWTGNTLIALRAVDEKDKSFAMGLIASFMSIFAYIPYPIIFGFVTDFSCLIWEESCSETGNCWLYDLKKFRINLHGTSSALLFIGSLFDLGALCYASRLKGMYEDVKEEPQEMSSKIKTNQDEQDSEVTLFDVSSEKRKMDSQSKTIMSCD